VATETAAQLLIATVHALSARAPAIVAAASHELGSIVLGLHFGDGTSATLRAKHSVLIVEEGIAADCKVEAYFDDRSLNLLFDLQRRPVDELLAGSLDVRGERADVLAVWRCFRLLSQRASGLRAVQAIWREYRDRKSDRWSTHPPSARRARAPRRQALRGTRWPALEYLDTRHPADSDELGVSLAPARSIWDGRAAHSWADTPKILDNDLHETMSACKRRVMREIAKLIPRREPRAHLYDLMRDYPARAGKGLRPTLTLATCMAFGGSAEDAARTAAAIELFHNGFLVHDDIADESTHRRGKPTLQEALGVGLAVNAGDALNLLAVDSVLSNLPSLGLARTLGLIHEIIHMCRETVEGQAIELGWIRDNHVPTRDRDYFRMSTKKTGWYTCISPCRLGAVCAGETSPEVLDRFNETFRLIGIAFQIQDDVLNLIGEQALYGKEPLGDLLEGKRTIIMIHLFRTAKPSVRKRMAAINAMPRAAKTFDHALEMLEAMRKTGSIDYAIALADRLAHRGAARFERDLAFIEENEAKAALRQIANYVTTRPL
jgi:geranylgeranyl diphosphate synthase type II